MYSFDEIANFDPEIAQAMTDEINRQDHNIELIASENIVSKAVMAAMGSPLTNKYAEGYPGKRYYGGCECVDVVEELARERAATFRRTGKYGSILRYFAAGRYIYGNESGTRWTSDTRFTGQYVR